MFTVADAYPPDAIGGADFLSGASHRTIVDTDVAGEAVRRGEKILVCDRTIDFEDRLEGRVCISEQTVRQMAAELGLVDRARVRAMERHITSLGARLEGSEHENRQLKRALDALGTDGLVTRLYVTPDGAEHASRDAAIAHMDPAVSPVNPPAAQPFQEV